MKRSGKIKRPLHGANPSLNKLCFPKRMRTIKNGEAGFCFLIEVPPADYSRDEGASLSAESQQYSFVWQPI
jgi:hypothetical protein